jgi:hypothetical protein
MASEEFRTSLLGCLVAVHERSWAGFGSGPEAVEAGRIRTAYFAQEMDVPPVEVRVPDERPDLWRALGSIAQFSECDLGVVVTPRKLANGKASFRYTLEHVEACVPVPAGS